MKKSKILITSVFVIFFIVSVSLGANNSVNIKKYNMTEKNNVVPGDTIHGFRLKEKRFVKETNSDVLLFEHEKSGARLIKFLADDNNKTFSIAFKTIPESDAGTPHIMEHCVLNGSKNFPVKSPFDVLIKGSLNTFLNAFTGKDMTMYPVASMNEKDYFNLMHVYLDAVFNPLIYDDERIFYQEGWHHELTDENSPVTYKGVVYNEMKGAFSSPYRVLRYEVFKNLFPDNGYGYESGGHPDSIPALTLETFLNFHKRYYHPENSYIVLYGDADLNKELAFIDSEYLSKFTRADKKPVIEDQKPFDRMKEISVYYPVLENASTVGQTFITLDFVTGYSTDVVLAGGLEIISEVLFNQESAPVRLALQNAGIGQDVSASLSGSYKQMVFQIMVPNANPEDTKKFYDIVTETLKDEIKKGFDVESVEGVLNRIEFSLREGDDAQKGLTYSSRVIPGWINAENPFLGLEWENPLNRLKEEVKKGYLEEITEKYILNNNHAVLLTVIPKPGLEKENNERIETELKSYKAGLNKEEIENLIKETKELIDYQKKEDTPEALSTIPMLELKDINREAEWYELKQTKYSDVPVLYYNEFTNDVVYVNMLFDMKKLPQDLIPYASLLSSLLTLLSTENYTYGDLNKMLNIHTGGFYTDLSSYLENMDDSKMISKFVVSSKAMNNKLDKLYELTLEILNKTIYEDTVRLKTILKRHQSQVENSVKSDGYSYARRRLMSYFSNQGLLDEMTSGLDYYWFLTDLTENFDKQSTETIGRLKQVSELLFTKENLIITTTCDEKDMDKIRKETDIFIKKLPESKPEYKEWKLSPVKKNEGLQTPSKVQYVVQGYDFKKLGYEWSGKMRVLNQIISTDWLQTQIRVIGGAYGGFCSFSPNGFVTFSSYRDPNLSETIERFLATPEYLKSFNADEKDMTRFIIGTIARIDRPLTAPEKGNQAAGYWFIKRSREDVQRDRDEILSVTQEDIKKYAQFVSDILAQKNYFVYGNAEKIEAQKGLFEKLIRIEREK